MPFLLPNQQHQSTEGISPEKNMFNKPGNISLEAQPNPKLLQQSRPAIQKLTVT